MFKNYLKITYRNLTKHKSYSLINIFGLSLGLTCCILILAYIGYELSFDRYHKNAGHIYRIASKSTTNGRLTEFAAAPVPFAPTMINDFPEVVDAVRISATVKRSFKYEDKHYFETGVLYVDKSIFNVFSFELVQGDPETALEAPFTMVVTEELAAKYFGNENPIGKIMQWDNNFKYRVTGVVKSPPPNSHFTFNALASFTTFFKYDPRFENMWYGFNAQTYLLLQENTNPKEFEQKLENFKEKYMGQILRSNGIDWQTYLQPLKSIHLHSNIGSELGTNSDVRLIYAFAAIAVVILLIACINFMNLATARSACRAKEVGMRKILGAERRKLVIQFLGESFTFAVLSLLIAIIMAQLVLPYFNNLASRQISINYLEMPWLVSGLAGIILFVGIIAGSYPAFFLSGFKPIFALKMNIQQGSKSSLLRSILVVSQFTISIILIIGTIVILKQQQYMKNKDIGFNKKHLLVIALQNKEVRTDLESFKNELLKINGVVCAGASSQVPGELYLFTNGTYPEGLARDQLFMMENFRADHDFFKTLEIEIVKGRGFSKEITTDEFDAVMINETAARTLEWDNPIGKTMIITKPVANEEIESEQRTVIGVYRDFHHRSLYSAVQPTFTRYISNEGRIGNRARRLALRMETADLAGTMALIEQQWQDFYPNIPYYSFFLEEFYDSRHRAEAKLGSIFRSFSILAVLIGCLGLFGLSSFIAEKRTKEIGIRRTIGATVISIVVLLCRNFIFLIVVANVIAWPVAYIALNKWLQNFPYPVSIGISTFVLTAFLTLIIALLTVGFQSVKAARANPVDSLRYE